MKTGDGRPLPAHPKAQTNRELDRLELVLPQLKAVEAERDALLKPVSDNGARCARGDAGAAEGGGTGIYGNTLRLKGFSAASATEGNWRHYGGLAPTPWQSGSVAHEQGVSPRPAIRGCERR